MALDTTAERPTRTPGAVRPARATMLVIGLGVSLIVVDATIVNVMLPRIITGLRLSTTTTEWVASVYPLAFAALLIPFGRLGDVRGRRRMFLAGTAVFVAGGLFAALAGNGGELVAARLVQGVGAAMVMPATMSSVNALYQGRERAIAFGVWGSLIGGMAALGPLLGGWLATAYGWRWGFAVTVPLGALLFAGILRWVPESVPRRRSEPPLWQKVGNADLAGGVLAGAGLAGGVFGLVEVEHYGWRLCLPVLGASAALLAALVAVERRRLDAGRSVVVDLSLYRIPAFRVANVTACLVSFGEFGLLFILPLFLQNIRAGSPLQTSLAILPLAVGAFLSGGAVRHVRVGPARLLQAGLLLETLATGGVALTLGAHTTGADLAPWMFAYGVGLGLASAQLTGVALRDVPAGMSGQAAGTQSTARQVGSALGVAVLGTVFVLTLGHGAATAFTTGTLPHADPALASATRRVAAIAAGLLALGSLVALRLREPDEAGRRLGRLGPGAARAFGPAAPDAAPASALGGSESRPGRGTPGDRGESSS